MTLDLAKIKAAAMAATQGEWEFWSGYVATDIDSDGGVIICERPRPSGGKFQKAIDNNFKHIAAANPAAVLELIERLENAERDTASKQIQIEQYKFLIAAFFHQYDCCIPHQGMMAEAIDALRMYAPIAMKESE